MKRSTFLKNLIGLYGLSSLPAKAVKQYQKIYLLQCFVRGFQYYVGPKIINQINQNGLVELVREPNNIYDNNAIALHFNKQKIGFVPREDNSVLSVLMDSELLKLQAEITHIEPKAATWENIHIAIYVLKEQENIIEKTKNDNFTLLETPKYYTLKSDHNSYTQIFYNEYSDVMDGEMFYQTLVENSKTDEVYGLIHDSFSTTQEMEDAISESRLLIRKDKIPNSMSIDELAERFNDETIKIDNLFDNEGYVVANINEIAQIPNKIEKFEKLLDKTGKMFFEVIFKT
jgi:hypothetical protein